MFKKHPKSEKEESVKKDEPIKKAGAKGKVIAPVIVEKDTKSKKESI
jgi:hypothetical protein